MYEVYVFSCICEIISWMFEIVYVCCYYEILSCMCLIYIWYKWDNSFVKKDVLGCYLKYCYFWWNMKKMI